MKKINIVKEKKDFNDIIASCPYVKDSNLVIYYNKDREVDLKYNRFGISVGTKIGNAVIRNLYKRRIRSIIDNNKKDYAFYADYIIIVRKNCLYTNYKDIENSFNNLMSKIN